MNGNRSRRKEGEECGNCVSWTRQVKRNPDMTIKVEADPVGTCDCGPPALTVIGTPVKDQNGRMGMELRDVTSFPPTMRKSAWCGQHQEEATAGNEERCPACGGEIAISYHCADATPQWLSTLEDVRRNPKKYCLACARRDALEVGNAVKGHPRAVED